jgi:glycosyltransferase involved in cell wall biosynthesis
MPTLLQINSVGNWGSTGRIAEEIGQAAIAKGWESYIAFGRKDRPSASKKIKIGTKWSIYLHVLKTRLFDLHGFGSTRATKKFIKQIETIKPDIIHLHNIHGYYINIEILFHYLAKVNIPIVWTQHDCWAFTGHCAYFDYVQCEKWKSLCYSCPQKTSYPASYGIDNSKTNFLKKKELFNLPQNCILVPVSKWLGNLLTKSFLNNFPVKQIYNGIDLSVFSPLQSDKQPITKDNSFTLLGVSSFWTQQKGFDDFIRLSQLIDPETKIILVGVNKKQLKKLPANIQGICRTESREKLAALYSQADLFLNLTYEDNFPTTNIEALACGTPVLTYNTGGSIEAVTPETGFIVEQGDLQSILEIIKLLKSKQKTIERAVCRKRALDFYNKDDRYNDYLELYHRLLISENKIIK